MDKENVYSATINKISITGGGTGLDISFHVDDIDTDLVLHCYFPPSNVWPLRRLLEVIGCDLSVNPVKVDIESIIGTMLSIYARIEQTAQGSYWRLLSIEQKVCDGEDPINVRNN